MAYAVLPSEPAFAGIGAAEPYRARLVVSAPLSSTIVSGFPAVSQGRIAKIPLFPRRRAKPTPFVGLLNLKIDRKAEIARPGKTNEQSAN
jgi:hypothetical protein